jgi:hypothetical protein
MKYQFCPWELVYQGKKTLLPWKRARWVRDNFSFQQITNTPISSVAVHSSYLSMVLHGLLIVPQEVVSVAKVTDGPALCLSIPQISYQFQVGSAQTKKQQRAQIKSHGLRASHESTKV